MEAARHAKELLLAEVERLSAARAKGKKGKKKKKSVWAWAIRAPLGSTRRCCPAVRELVASSILMRI